MPRTGTKILLSLAFAAVFAAPAAAQERIYGITAADSQAATPTTSLVTFTTTTPFAISTVGTLTGLVSNHTVRSIDFRPSNGQLYALSTSPTSVASAQLYTVNLSTAALTPVGPGFILGSNNSDSVDIDFNPVTDTLRVVTGTGDGGNNFRVSPTTGTLVSADSTLVYGGGDPHAGFSPGVVGIAHSNNVAGAASTTLYAWDYTNDGLARIGGPGGAPSPDLGGMTTIHSPASFFTSFDGIGVDISGYSGVFYATHDDPETGTQMGLYTRNLTTGAETLVGNYPAGTFITGISVSPIPAPEPGLLVGCGLAVVGWAARRRRA